MYVSVDVEFSMPIYWRLVPSLNVWNTVGYLLVLFDFSLLTVFRTSPLHMFLRFLSEKTAVVTTETKELGQPNSLLTTFTLQLKGFVSSNTAEMTVFSFTTWPPPLLLLFGSSSSSRENNHNIVFYESSLSPLCC